MTHAGLYDPHQERDACGIGVVADASGTPSRGIVEAALEGLCGVKHRGAVAADERTGDGAGLLLPLPRTLLGDETGADPERLGVAMCFLDPRADEDGEHARDGARLAVERALADSGLEHCAWRVVPTDPGVLGRLARADMPRIEQAVFAVPPDVEPDGEAAERRSYVARKRAERSCREQGVRAYFASWSTRTVTYKAMSAADQLEGFYPDLADERVTGWFAIFHQRYSTNTLPAWERAQPFRHLAHNGEINTIDGNCNLMRARAARLGAGWPELGAEGDALLAPVIDTSNSDSARLDDALGLLVRGGRSVQHAMAMLVPQVWEGRRDVVPEVTDFFRYHSALVEPWDGPAGLVYTDGLHVAASLDRNGLRPLRYQVCADGMVVVSSEVGAVSLAGHGRVRRERLGPGQMLVIDPARGGLVEDAAVKRSLAARRPYGEWVREQMVPITPGQPVEEPDAELGIRQVVAGYTKEEQTTVLRPMANDGKEPISSMGDDTSLAALATRPRTIYHFLKQRFAQVTNPPIDHLREFQVMSLRTLLGRRQPLLSEVPEAANLLALDGFVLYPQGLQELVLNRRRLDLRGLDATFAVADGGAGLSRRLTELAAEAEGAVRDGAGVLVLSDRSVDAERAPVPAVLAVGAVHHALVRAGLRTLVSLIAETDDARETHTFACLLGYGADAIVPRLALESIAELADANRLGRDAASSGESQESYRHAVEDGVLKIMSKMGISTLDSYRSAQTFEAIGLGADVIEAALVGTPSQIGGINLAAVGTDVLSRHTAAFGGEDDDGAELASPGFYKFRKGGDYHATNPDVVGALHRTVGLEGELGRIDADALGTGSHIGDVKAAHLLRAAMQQGRWEPYEAFAAAVNDRPPAEPRDLLEIVDAAEPVPLSEVEPATSVVQRFFTGAMSLGALSPEAHETLAMAMNSLGGMSNCGEGGEDPARFVTRGTAQDRNSKAKQVASGRFGVTPYYLAVADELQIKIAQGAKPGEGGQLPGHKVSELIARLRHTQPGVTLISPPPHHDIYSIEDLAQLIYDLKQVNPFASISVKLVASAGVGTVAAGVVKGLADAVQIAGSDGGTGASPLSSIKHAGLPWELGLAETQQALVRNGLRGRARLQVDGGFKTGRDVLIGALLGADEYGFGTAALVAEGCIMVRACHRDTCPVGITTQRPQLREKFEGTPEMVATYLLLVAEEVRRGLAALGLRSVDAAIGRVDLLRPRDMSADPRALSLDVTPLLADPFGPDGSSPARADSVVAAAEADPDAASPARCHTGTLPLQSPRDQLGDRVFEEAFQPLWDGTSATLAYEIRNADRTVGARLGGAVGLEYAGGRPEGTVSVAFTGQAGQSFGAFLAPGIAFELTGEANDYVGKGMGGGRIVVRPPADDAGAPVLVGNTVLYGATGGELFVAGRAGERFAVRNSGATAVVEGVGDHACEYMTGGVVVVLGATGTNLGAGMTGGECYVLDPTSEVLARINGQLVDARRPDGAQMHRLRDLLARHHELTGSELAARLLDRWADGANAFWRVAPRGEMSRMEAAMQSSVGASA